jgi:hypothetical protein
MTTESSNKADFRAPTTSKRLPRAVADGIGGMILAVAEIAGTPEQVFRALTTNEVEQWWKFPGVYHQKDWKADLRVCGPWSVTVELVDGKVRNRLVSCPRNNMPFRCDQNGPRPVGCFIPVARYLPFLPEWKTGLEVICQPNLKRCLLRKTQNEV